MKIKDIENLTMEEKIAYISKLQKEVAVAKMQIAAVKKELQEAYPTGTPNYIIGYKVTVNYSYPVFTTTKVKTGETVHYTVTIK